MTPSHSYLKVGLLVAAFTAILFIPFGMLAFPLLGLTCGFTTRNGWRCLAGLIISAACSLIFLMLTIGSSVTRSLSPEFGLFQSGSMANYIGALLGACMGAVFALPQERLISFASTLCIINMVNLMIVSCALIHLFPGKLFDVQVWEYATLLVAVAIVGLGIWGPIELISQKQFKHCDPLFDYWVALKKSL